MSYRNRNNGSWLNKTIIFCFYLLASINAFAEYELSETRTFDEYPASIENRLENQTLVSSLSDSYVEQDIVNAISPEIQQQIDEIKELTDLVKLEKRLIDKLDDKCKVEYPIGIVSPGADYNYAIILNGDVISPEQSYLTAYMCFEIPTNGEKMAFKSDKIMLSADGGITGETRMDLLTDNTINFGKNIKLHIHSDGTYVVFDCDGFKTMTINGTVEFSEDMFVLEDPATGEIKAGTMKSDFTTTIYDWNDLVVELSLPVFQVKKLKGFSFEAKKASFDFSDLRNPSGIVYPADYNSPSFIDGNKNLWRGIFISEATVRLPKQLNEGAGRMSMNVKNLLIDEMGLTGVFTATSLLDLDKGAMAGWQYSIDNLTVTLVSSQIKDGSMKGKMILPIMDDKQTLAYSTIIDPDGLYFFSITTLSQINVPLWKAQVQLYANSSVSVKYENDNFEPSATLYGSISIDAPLGPDGGDPVPNDKKGFKLSGLNFEGMQLKGEQLIKSIGTWSLAGNSSSSDKMNGFPLTIKNVLPQQVNTRTGLSFELGLNLMKDKYCANATIKIWGEQEIKMLLSNVLSRKYKFSGVEVETITLEANDTPVKINGSFSVFKQDNIYGDGFYGTVQAEFASIGVTAIAQFGEINSMKYWYVDAMALMKKSPILLGGVGIYGIGGGAYHHMKQKALLNIMPGEVDESSFSTEPSKTNSGIQYVPDKNTYMGFKATVVLGTASNPKSFNADATLEMTFNGNGGLSTISFTGNGYFMTELEFGNPNKVSPFYANVLITYDFDNKILHGNFSVFVNAADGMITGKNANNKAGEMVMHWEQQTSKWYIHIGKPSEPVGLKIDLAIAQVESSCYFMMGTELEPMPPPPDKVTSLLGSSYVPNRSMDNLSLGKGFSFGASLSVGTGDLKFLMFYGSFECGVGFDVILADRGEAICIETGRPLGVNGWYAEGQAYAFVEGNIGIKCTVFKKDVDAKILSIGAAVLVEAKLPNPFWMRGTVGGYYSILGGLVEGRCSFQLEVGSQCTIAVLNKAASPVATIEAISDLTPKNGETNVDVFNAPQAVFNYQIDKVFTLTDNNNNSQSFRIRLDHFKVLDSDGNQIGGNYEWNATNDVVAFNSFEILPGKTKIKLEAQVSFEEKVNGTWVKVKDNGAPITEKKSFTFTTGTAPDYIPENNIVYEYPIANMLNFYKDEYHQGYMQLEKGQAYLFENKAGEEWVQRGRFTPVAGGSPVECSFTYDSTVRKITYNLPTALKTGTIYRLNYVNVPASAAAAIDQNVTETTTSTQAAEGVTVSQKAKTAEGSLSLLQEKQVYECYFRTSVMLIIN